jgi:hypothetical protein
MTRSQRLFRQIHRENGIPIGHIFRPGGEHRDSTVAQAG